MSGINNKELLKYREKIKVDYKAQGKKNRAQGASFEKRVFEDLKLKGWIVSRWPNKVEFKKEDIYGSDKESLGIPDCKIPVISMEFGELVQAKAKWINGRVIGMNSGFPDFIAFRRIKSKSYNGEMLKDINLFDIIGVECKINNLLDRKEKDQLNWYLKNNIFSKILIAYKTKEKNRVKVNYREFNSEVYHEGKVQEVQKE